ncbi:metalloregulator ArsR/SmtB family transcription factor [Patescibacteria group bacterium]|nr:metalloregulator ArsR/SmtB family transcription factor [Patescibacteria group bacterium]
MGSYNCCLPNKQEFERIKALSSLLKLVAEESRLKLLCVLRQGRHCVCEIAEHFEMSQSLISHHLADLKEAGLVKDEPKGRRVYYSLTKKGQKVSDLIFNL